MDERVPRSATHGIVPPASMRQRTTATTTTRSLRAGHGAFTTPMGVVTTPNSYNHLALGTNHPLDYSSTHNVQTDERNRGQTFAEHQSYQYQPTPPNNQSHNLMLGDSAANGITSSPASALNDSTLTATAPTAAVAVRRNLFQTHLSRRPTASSSTSSSIMPAGGPPPMIPTSLHNNTMPPPHATMETNGLPNGFRPPASSSADAPLSHLLSGVTTSQESAEIVVRNRHGEIEMEEQPALASDDLDEIGVERDKLEIQSEQCALAVAVRQYLRHTSPHDPEVDLVDAVRSNLKTRMAMMVEDNWMFENETGYWVSS